MKSLTIIVCGVEQTDKVESWARPCLLAALDTATDAQVVWGFFFLVVCGIDAESVVCSCFRIQCEDGADSIFGLVRDCGRCCCTAGPHSRWYANVLPPDLVARGTVRLDTICACVHVSVLFAEDDEFAVGSVPAGRVAGDLSEHSVPTSVPTPVMPRAPVPWATLARSKDWTIEILAGVVLVAMVVVYLYGRAQNSKLITKLNELLRPLLREQFAQAGSGTNIFGSLSANQYDAWVSGRQNCFGMLIDVTLKNRQDVVASFLGSLMPQLATMFAPAGPAGGKIVDIITFEVPLSQAVEAFVFALIPSKAHNDVLAAALDLRELSEKFYSAADFDLPQAFEIVTEHREIPGALLTRRFKAFVNDNAGLVKQLYVTDQAIMPDSKEPSNVYRTYVLCRACVGG